MTQGCGRCVCGAEVGSANIESYKVVIERLKMRRAMKLPLSDREWIFES